MNREDHSSVDQDEVTEVCLSGGKLFGDDFSAEQILRWFEDEAEGYYNLGSGDKEQYAYGYHALNRRHGFGFLPDRKFEHVLGMGSAYGDELIPILENSSAVTILEPADGFAAREIHGVAVRYVKPQPSGTLPFDAESFDLISCLGVLHHIPNVSTVVGEMFRCLKRGGYALIREPIHSMGDWRRPRPGLTRRERGIPLRILRRTVIEAGFQIVREKKCMFSLTSRWRYFLHGPVFNNALAVRIDEIVSSLPIWPEKYHATRFLEKLRPISVYYVLRRPETGDTKVHGS